VITEATLRLLPLPAARGTLLAVFDRMEAAAAAVSGILKAKVIPSAIEFLDSFAIGCVEDFQPSGLPRDAGAVLVLEVDGGPAEVAAAKTKVSEVLQACAARQIRVAADESEAERLWEARRAVGPSLARIAPHKMNEDIVVPVSRLPEAVSRIHAIAQKHQVACACFGHAGDGNIHVNFLLHKEDTDQVRRTEAAVEETFRLVVELGGSITGEHGVGTTKRPYLHLEIPPVVLEIMARVKKALDPNGILNPGKILP
jgi:glycolate oxidase